MMREALRAQLAVGVCVIAVACGDDRPPPMPDAGGLDAMVDGGQLAALPALPNLGDCPEGWRSAEAEPAICEPWPMSGIEDCDGAAEHFVGEAGCAPIGAPCPATAWPADLPTSGVSYVLAAAAPGGDGSIDQPFMTVVDAVAVATSGAVIAVGAGTYDGPFVLPDGVSLIGKCVDETTITCSVTDCSSGVIEVRGGSASARDVRVTGERPAFWVDGGALALNGILVDTTRVGGMAVLNGGRLTGDTIVVRNVRPRVSDGSGIGLYVEDASVDVTRFAMKSVPDVGINVFGPTASVQVDGLSVRDTTGPGVGVSGGASVTLTNAYLGQTSGHGLVVLDAGTTANVTRAIIEHTRFDPSTGAGAADVRSGAALTLAQTVIRNHSTTSVVVFEGSSTTLTDVLIADQPISVATQAGVGIGLGSTARLERVVVERVGTSGIIVQQPGSRAELTDVTIRDTLPADDGFFGRGLDVLVGAVVEGERVRVQRSYEVGLLVAADGADAQLRDLTVEDVLERRCAADTCADLGLGCGVSSILDATLNIDGFRISGNALCGLQLARGGVADATDGEIVDNVIGANVQTEGFDTARISTGVTYDNVRNLDAAAVAVPDPGAL